MYMYRSIAVLIALSCLRQVYGYGASTTLGLRFLLVVPKMLDSAKQVVCFFFTLSNKKVVVKIGVPWYGKNQDTNYFLRHVTVERNGISSVEMSKDYNLDIELGTTWSFKFDGEDFFGMCVLMADSKYSADTFTALPIAGWGTRYIAMTLHENPTINIVNGDEVNTVTLYIKITWSDGPKELKWNDVNYKNGDKLEVNLRRWEGFVFSYCPLDYNRHGSFTGTNINSLKPIGVVSGNCLSGTMRWNPRCEDFTKSEYTASRDVLTEMLMPIASFGREFISIVNEGRLSKTTVMILAAEDNTKITFSINDQGGTKEVTIVNAGEWKSFDELDLKDVVLKFVSDKGIQALLVEDSACIKNNIRTTPGELGDPAISLLIPNNLFFDNYIWSTPMTTVIRPKNYVTMVIDYTKIDLIRLDNLKLPDTITWREVTGMKNWKVGSTSVTEGTHTLHSTLLVYFGCYLYGMFDFYGYMHPGGYISGNINEACEETMKTMARGDLLDNDCDRRIDEEMMDGKDNDGDTLVDEDLAKPNRVDGGWGEWSQWACSNDCNVRSQSRIRNCDNPLPENEGMYCPEQANETKQSTCYVGSVCPKDCPVFRWGSNCEQSCVNCDPDCDKFLGTCTKCQSGFKYPGAGCSQPCEAMEFGPNCIGKCMEKCGADCIERSHGECASNLLKYAPLIVSFWLIPCIAYFVFCSDRNKDDKDKDDSGSHSGHSLETAITGVTESTAVTEAADTLFTAASSDKTTKD